MRPTKGPEKMKIAYRFYSIKHRPRLNAAGGSKIINKRRPRINAAPNQCGVYSRTMTKNSVQLINLHHPDNYDSISTK